MNFNISMETMCYIFFLVFSGCFPVSVCHSEDSLRKQTYKSFEYKIIKSYFILN